MKHRDLHGPVLCALLTAVLTCPFAARAQPPGEEGPLAAEPGTAEQLNESIAQVLPASAPGEVKFLSYQLSYIESARAVALLNTLGYKIVHYSVAEGGGVSATATEAGSLVADPSGAAGTRPVVIQLLEPISTTIVGASNGSAGLGGQVFDTVTSGVPDQRLMIAWTDAKELHTLLALIHDQVDIPAKQILIEALVIELTQDSIRDLGFDYSANKDGTSVGFGVDPSGTGTAFSPLSVTFARPAARTLLEFTGRITALVNAGDAEVLSRPSVLVLDGRQARIKIGDKFPYVETLTTTFGETLVSDTKYIDVGIVLNLRPRASDDNSEVTMQVETQVSSSAGSAGGGIGPQVQNREVQTLVRVANNTPLIIAGLISQSRTNASSGVPGLSKIPWFGRLFQRSSRSRKKTEVIVVIIPHVVPPEEKAFSYSIAKDSELFDQFDLNLFQNIYRVRHEDVWDLDFIRESTFYDCLERTAKLQAQEIAVELRDSGRTPVAASNTVALAQELRAWIAEPTEPRGSTNQPKPPPPKLTEPYIQLLEGTMPGEHIWIKRMLLEIVRKHELASNITDENVIFFEKSDSGPVLDIEKLAPRISDLRGRCETLEMFYTNERGESSGLVFDPPSARLTTRSVEADDYLCRMRERNCLSPRGDRWDSLAILLNDCYEWEKKERRGPAEGSLDLLKNVLVLKRVLDLNPTLPLTLEDFHVGRELLFPTDEDLAESSHLVDREAAALFYETLDSYYAFEQLIRRAVDGLVQTDVRMPANCTIPPGSAAGPSAPKDCVCEPRDRATARSTLDRGSGDGRAWATPEADEVSGPQVSIRIDYSTPLPNDNPER